MCDFQLIENKFYPKMSHQSHLVWYLILWVWFMTCGLFSVAVVTSQWEETQYTKEIIMAQLPHWLINILIHAYIVTYNYLFIHSFIHVYKLYTHYTTVIHKSSIPMKERKCSTPKKSSWHKLNFKNEANLSIRISNITKSDYHHLLSEVI